MVSIEYIKQSTYKKTHWDGGQTIEVCLSPKNGGKYEIGYFDYRVSSATIELLESKFSQLPGYKRIILTLDSAIQLSHGNEYFTLLPLTPYYFDGGIKTVSKGTCTDFNLIYKPEYNGDITVLKKECRLELKKYTHYIIFAIEQLVVLVDGKEISIQEGDSLSIDNANNETMIHLKSSIHKPFGILVSVSKKD